jgi:hypothetical protein
MDVISIFWSKFRVQFAHAIRADRMGELRLGVLLKVGFKSNPGRLNIIGRPLFADSLAVRADWKKTLQGFDFSKRFLKLFIQKAQLRVLLGKLLAGLLDAISGALQLQMSAHTSQELCRVKRLGHIIYRANLKALDNSIPVGLRG